LHKGLDYLMYFQVILSCDGGLGWYTFGFGAEDILVPNEPSPKEVPYLPTIQWVGRGCEKS
jgi:hypothetical protein